MRLEKYVDWRYDLVHITLAALYILLFLLCFTVVIRLVIKGNWNLRWQKFFHPVIMLGCLIRATFFLLQPFIMEHVLNLQNQVNMVLNTFPSFLFFTNYLIILFLWAEIYHYASEASHVGIEKLKPIFLVITLSMYSVVAVLYSLDFILYPPQYLNVSMAQTKVERAVYIFGVSIYTLTSVGFILYGIGIYFKVSSMPVYTNTRKQVLRKIQVISMLVSLCFITRSGIIVAGVIFPLSVYWWFDGVYYLIWELVPLVLMLQLLHGDSRRGNKNTASKDSAETTGLLNT